MIFEKNQEIIRIGCASLKENNDKQVFTTRDAIGGWSHSCFNPLILAAIGTPAQPPKTRGKSPGRAQGHQPPPRLRYPNCYKCVDLRVMIFIKDKIKNFHKPN